ncbi:hypothetical protein [Microbacterium sp. zg-YB36]|uniref:hypothetical protein n=1 Tax=Microbacterium sp. zg-YB36 TaxID=2969407 RepID=UPI00214BBD28|nr:hypothetical protein [Microbacterium sp. zg-YB36]MDL5351170.1 hypothetical protein [Microbacterium sp. zg-YB36]
MSDQEAGGETLAARIHLVVDVYKGTDPGIDTPDVRELPYEYLVIREAEAESAEGFIHNGIFSVVNEGLFEDPDPDGVLVRAVTEGLSMLAGPWLTEKEATA